MKGSVTYSVGNLGVIDKSDALLGGYFLRVFGGVAGRAVDFVPMVKLFMYNRLGDCLATNRLVDYPGELFTSLGFEEKPCERSLYRMVERVGRNYVFVLEEYQRVLVEHGLVSSEQFPDFSSSYFEGRAEALGMLGYSRDGQPGKRQIVFGVSTGINEIPTALTIQKGNVLDKAHFRFMLRTAEAVLKPNSVLIFDAGANTKKNKKLIRGKEFHYLTRKQKKVETYRKHVRSLNKEKPGHLNINQRDYFYVKKKEGEEYLYVFFSPQLLEEQLRKKKGRFEKHKKKGNKLAKKARKHRAAGRYPCDRGWVELYPKLQATLRELSNPYVTGIEGFFVLESSLDAEPEKILRLYKERDKAEKLVRNIKEGTELRPMRHWSTDAIIGHVVLVFLTNFHANLTLLKARKPALKNVKLLKKYLTKLTVTVVYPPNGFRFHILSNISPEILSILGNFIDKYRDKTLPLRW